MRNHPIEPQSASNYMTHSKDITSAQKTYSSYGLKMNSVENKITEIHSPSRSNVSAMDQPKFALRMKDKH